MGFQASGAIQSLPGERNPSTHPGTIRAGKIRAVDTERWVVTVDFEDTHQHQVDIPVISPYFNHREGQGAYFMPEQDSRCVLVFAYDTWAILGYLPPIDPKHIDDLTKSTRKIQAHNQAHVKLTKPEGAEATLIKSYRNKRESDMKPGDYCIKTRAYNKSKWYTTGNILHESTKTCWRLYSALSNLIEDQCDNYTLRTPGGFYRWTNEVLTGESDTRREVKRFTTETYSSYVEIIGHDAAVFERMVRSPELISEFELHLPEDEKPYIVEHFREHIASNGAWERRVNENWHRDANTVFVDSAAQPKFDFRRRAYNIRIEKEGSLTEVINEYQCDEAPPAHLRGYKLATLVGSYPGDGIINSRTLTINENILSGEIKYQYDTQRDGTTSWTIQKSATAINKVGWKQTTLVGPSYDATGMINSHTIALNDNLATGEQKYFYNINFDGSETTKIQNKPADTKIGFEESVIVGSFDGQGMIQAYSMKINQDTSTGEFKYGYSVSSDGATIRTINKAANGKVKWQETITPLGDRHLVHNESSPGTHMISFLADGTKIVNQAKDQVKDIKGKMTNSIAKNFSTSVKRNVTQQIKGMQMKNCKRPKLDIGKSIQLKLGKKFQFLNMLPSIPGVGAIPMPMTGLMGMMGGELSGSLGILNGLPGVLSQVQGLAPSALLGGLTSSLTSTALGAIDGAVGDMASGALGALGEATGTLSPLGDAVQGVLDIGISASGIASKLPDIGSVDSASVLAGAFASIDSAVASGALDSSIATIARSLGNSLSVPQIENFWDISLGSMVSEAMGDINLDNAVSTFALAATSIQDFKDNYLGTVVDGTIGLMSAVSGAAGAHHMTGNYLVSAVTEATEEIVEA